jgi:phage shock protein A
MFKITISEPSKISPKKRTFANGKSKLYTMKALADPEAEKARQNAIIVRGKAAQTRLGVRRTLSDHNIDDAIARFELYARKMDDLEGEIEAYDMGQKTLSDEIAELETDEGVHEQLTELKARIAGQHDTRDSVVEVNSSNT